MPATEMELPLREAAARWGRSPVTLRERLRLGTLAGRKVGPVWVVTIAEMERAYGPEPKAHGEDSHDE